jgi:hypothetical protein
MPQHIPYFVGHTPTSRSNSYIIMPWFQAITKYYDNECRTFSSDESLSEPTWPVLSVLLLARYMPSRHARGGTVTVIPFREPCVRRGWLVSAKSRPIYPRERHPVPIVQGLGDHLVVPGFDSQTIHPLASRYTDWDIQVPSYQHR